MPPRRPAGLSPTEQAMNLKIENRELKSKLADMKEKLSALRKAAKAEARVVRGSTVHVKIPGISKANLHDVPNIEDLLKEIKRLEGAIKALETLVETTQAEVAFEQAANVRLKENVASLEKLATRLKDELDVKSKQLEAAVSRAVEADIRASRADAEAKRMATEAARSAAQAKQYKDAAAQADKLVKEKGRMLVEMGATNNALQRQVKDGEAARATVQAALNVSTEENERLRRAIGAGGMLAKMAKDKEAEQAKRIAEAAEEIRMLEKKVKLLNRLATGGSGSGAREARATASPEL